jgi:hypothetical protein
MLDKNGDQAGPLGGSVEHSEGKGRESVVAIPRFLCGSPHLCRLRTEGLELVSKYWTYQSHASVYGPSKPNSLPSIDAWLKPTASLAGLGEKLRWVPWTTQQDWEVGSGALFLGSSSIHPMLLTTYERLLPMGIARKKRTSGVRHLEWEAYVSYGRVFPCRVYIDLNHHDSRIWVTTCSWLPSSSNLLD